MYRVCLRDPYQYSSAKKRSLGTLEDSHKEGKKILAQTWPRTLGWIGRLFVFTI